MLNCSKAGCSEKRKKKLSRKEEKKRIVETKITKWKQRNDDQSLKRKNGFLLVNGTSALSLLKEISSLNAIIIIRFNIVILRIH